MTVDEVRSIRETISLETIGMTAEELHTYFSKSTARIEQRIAEIRKEKGIVLTSANNNQALK